MNSNQQQTSDKFSMACFACHQGKRGCHFTPGASACDGCLRTEKTCIPRLDERKTKGTQLKSNQPETTTPSVLPTIGNLLGPLLSELEEFLFKVEAGECTYEAASETIRRVLPDLLKAYQLTQQAKEYLPTREVSSQVQSSPTDVQRQIPPEFQQETNVVPPMHPQISCFRISGSGPQIPPHDYGSQHVVDTGYAARSSVTADIPQGWEPDLEDPRSSDAINLSIPASLPAAGAVVLHHTRASRTDFSYRLVDQSHVGHQGAIRMEVVNGFMWE